MQAKPGFVNIGEEQHRLAFSMDAWEKIDTEICPIGRIGEAFSERGSLGATIAVAAVMINEALTQDGKAPVMTAQYIRAHMLPRDVFPAQAAILAAIGDSWKMETETRKDPDAPVDVVAEEIQKKETPGG